VKNVAGAELKGQAQRSIALGVLGVPSLRGEPPDSLCIHVRSSCDPSKFHIQEAKRHGKVDFCSAFLSELLAERGVPCDGGAAP
jgi:hypothetical protein